MAPWGQNRFLEDESLYAYWGLQIASGADPMLDHEPVDKPPLHPYLLALSFRLLQRDGPQREADLWPAETAARLPSLAASVSGIALVYALARRLARLTPPPGGTLSGTKVRRGSDDGWPLLAAFLVAVSPFDILFASTVFTDPLLSALVLAALLAAAGRRLGVAGLLTGLALATKQQAVLFVPLIVAAGGFAAPAVRQASLAVGGAERGLVRPRRQGGRLAARPWVFFVVGVSTVVGGCFWWDAARIQRPGFLGQSFVSYGGLGLARTSEMGQRALEWSGLVGTFWANPAASGLLLAGFALWGAASLSGRCRPWRPIDIALAATLCGVLVLHWLVGFQVWDRYLLGLVPLCALLAARALDAIAAVLPKAIWRRAWSVAVPVVLAALLAQPVVAATRSRLAVGGDHGAYDGIEELAGYLRETAPPGAVLYHYWLGYHYRFYLYGAGLRLHWYPDLEDLVRDAAVYRHEARYIAFPSWRDGEPTLAALAGAGVTAEELLRTKRRDGTVSFRLYRLAGP